MELASHYNMLTLQYTVIILLEQLWSQSTYDIYGCMALKAPEQNVDWVTLESVSDTQKTVIITRSPAVLITTCERAASATPAMFFINLVIQSSRSGRPPIADCTWHQMRSGFSSASNEIKMSPSQGLRYCTNTNTSSSLGTQQYQNNG